MRVDAASTGNTILDSGTDAQLVVDAAANAVRASLGSLFWVPVANATFAEFAAWSRQHQYHVYGTSAHGSVDYLSVERYEPPALLLLGSEREGLTPEQLEGAFRSLGGPLRVIHLLGRRRYARSTAVAFRYA